MASSTFKVWVVVALSILIAGLTVCVGLFASYVPLFIRGIIYVSASVYFIGGIIHWSYFNHGA